MSDTERSLHQAIVETPDSLEPRIRYADLIRSSDPDRAEFIDLQIEVHKQRRTIVGPKTGDWNTPFRASQKLLERHQQKWAHDFSRLVDEYLFIRGFIEYIKMDAARFLDLGPHLYSLAPIRHLGLTGIKPVIEQVFASQLLGQAVGLYLSSQSLDDDDIVRLVGCRYLEKITTLNLLGNNVGEAGLAALATTKNLPNLEYVNFHNNVTPNPTDDYAIEPMGWWVTDAWRSEAGKKLEDQFGYQKWIHGPHRFPQRYPPLMDDY